MTHESTLIEKIDVLVRQHQHVTELLYKALAEAQATIATLRRQQLALIKAAQEEEP